MLLKSLLAINETNEAKPLTGAAEKFDNWLAGRGDLCHPAFPEKFMGCVESYIRIDDYAMEPLENIAMWFADNLTSFSGERLLNFIDYVKSHPLPKNEAEEEKFDADEYAKDSEEYWIITCERNRH